MKGLSIEEKAKRYDEAIERAKSKIKNDKDHVLYEEDVIEIFPGFKESEDERIRKAISQCVEDMRGPFEKLYGVHHKDAIAWLEKKGEKRSVFPKFRVGDTIQSCFNKQAIDKVIRIDDDIYILSSGGYVRIEFQDNWKLVEQKPADKVEPKFKVGDWVVNKGGKVNQVVAINDDCDGFTLDDDTYFSGSWCDMYHLWTIQDAKDGDVLCCESGWTCIFKTLVNEETFSSYCFIDRTKWFCETGSECHTLKEEFVKAYNGKIYPATKEQRALLFQKMHEAGYEWDAEKKELKKIEPHDANGQVSLDCEEICDNAWKDFVKRWNEEAEKYHDAWLERVKGAVSEKTKAPKQEWSEEDRKIIIELIGIFGSAVDGEHVAFPYRLLKDYIRVLKSCLHQSTWKPSDEQIEALALATLPDVHMKYQEALKELYEDLKNLKNGEITNN